MLGNRIYIDKYGNKQPLIDIEKVEKNMDERGDGTFIIKANNGDEYAVKIVFQKITSTGKQSLVSEFFKEYARYKRIIIAREYTGKIADYMIKHRTQIFKESSLLKNIINYRDQPKFELLSPAEMKQFKLEYNVTHYTTKKLTRNDPIAKYFALKKGEIIRIIRPSQTSGEAIDYRIVS